MIELKNEYLTVQFKEMGGTISSIKDMDGIEYLWQGDPTYWSGQAPVLFPICGSLRMDWAIYRPNERPYFTGTIPRHGLVRKKLFQVTQVSDNQVHFTIESDEEMYQQYPYHFRLTIVYRLEGRKILTEYLVFNLDRTKTMPFFIGGHPGFNCPLLSDECYEDYYLEFEKEETCTVPRQFPDTGLLDLLDRTPFLRNQKILNLDYGLFEKDAVTLDELQSRQVCLKSKNHDKGIKLSFEDFPYLILWSTTNQSPFIALEPWSGLSTSLEESDHFDEKRNVSFVDAGKTATRSFSIEILDGSSNH